MMRPVPAVSVTTISMMAYQLSFEMIEVQDAEAFVPNRAPERATVISVVDCRTPSAIVR